jgi:hypothetical protein
LLSSKSGGHRFTVRSEKGLLSSAARADPCSLRSQILLVNRIVCSLLADDAAGCYFQALEGWL